MPRTLALLEQGELVVARARALIDASRPAEDDLVRLLDEELADRACYLPPTRIRAAVDKVALRHGVDTAAARSARAAAARGTRFSPLPDGQAEFALTGPAPAVAQARAALDADARAWSAALRGTGDGRGIDQLRCDLGLHRLLGGHAQPVAPGKSVAPDAADRNTSAGAQAVAETTDRSDRPDRTDASAAAPTPAGGPPVSVPAETPPDDPCSVIGLPDPTAPSWWTDRRFSRPVRLDITVPITTALGLSDEPGWLPGYGWVSAPTVRQLLPAAELRQACLAADGPAAGQLVDVADRVVRPGCGAAAVRAALLTMAAQPFEVTDKTWRTEPRHDPSPALAEFVRLRDRHCDGPVGGRPLPAQDADLDHDKPYDHGKPYDPLDDDVRLGDVEPCFPLDDDVRLGDVERHDDAAPIEHDGDGAVGHGGPFAGRRPRRVRPEESWLIGDGVAWAAHGDLGLDLDPATGFLTLVDLEHDDVRDLPRPDATGPTAAWNLIGRGRRSHGLKHRGWTPLRTATSTLWFTPAGQSVEVPHELDVVGPLSPDRVLVDPQQLYDEEAALLRHLDPLASLEVDDEGEGEVDDADEVEGPSVTAQPA